MTMHLYLKRALRVAAAAVVSGAACGSPAPRAEPERGVTPGRAPNMAAFTRPTDEELRKRLTPEQYRVTRHEGTEAPFRNAYWDEHRPGIYVDVVSGEPLFSSRDKFDSGTGWPSFTRPIDPGHIRARTDWKLLLQRTEVRSRLADSHLGHVFDDGPPPTGLRYCINSAALRFVPLERLAPDGYGEFLASFEGAGQAAGSGSAAP